MSHDGIAGFACRFRVTAQSLWLEVLSACFKFRSMPGAVGTHTHVHREANWYIHSCRTARCVIRSTEAAVRDNQQAHRDIGKTAWGAEHWQIWWGWDGRYWAAQWQLADHNESQARWGTALAASHLFAHWMHVYRMIHNGTLQEFQAALHWLMSMLSEYPCSYGVCYSTQKSSCLGLTFDRKVWT